jgi:hypothetical protein
VYKDANHPQGFRKIMIGRDKTATIEGSDTSTVHKDWTLKGTVVSDSKDFISIDFSPKGGAKDLLGKLDGSRIVFPDGITWARVDWNSLSGGKHGTNQAAKHASLQNGSSKAWELMALRANSSKAPGCPVASRNVTAVFYLLGHLRSFPYSLAGLLFNAQCMYQQGWGHDGSGGQVLTIIVTRDKNMLPSDPQKGSGGGLRMPAGTLVAPSHNVLELMAGTFCSPVFARILSDNAIAGLVPKRLREYAKVSQHIDVLFAVGSI